MYAVWHSSARALARRFADGPMPVKHCPGFDERLEDPGSLADWVAWLARLDTLDSETALRNCAAQLLALEDHPILGASFRKLCGLSEAFPEFLVEAFARHARETRGVAAMADRLAGLLIRAARFAGTRTDRRRACLERAKESLERYAASRSGRWDCVELMVDALLSLEGANQWSRSSASGAPPQVGLEICREMERFGWRDRALVERSDLLEREGLDLCGAGESIWALAQAEDSKWEAHWNALKRRSTDLTSMAPHALSLLATNPSPPRGELARFFEKAFSTLQPLAVGDWRVELGRAISCRDKGRDDGGIERRAARALGAFYWDPRRGGEDVAEVLNGNEGAALPARFRYLLQVGAPGLGSGGERPEVLFRNLPLVFELMQYRWLLHRAWALGSASAAEIERRGPWNLPEALFPADAGEGEEVGYSREDWESESDPFLRSYLEISFTRTD